MTVRIYTSQDASAPSLTGAAGSLTSLLDAVLVNGYGSQTAAGWTIGQTTTNKRQYIMAAGGTGFSLYVDDTAPGGGGAREARVCGFQSMSAITPTGVGQFPTSSQSTIGVGTLVIRKSASADATVRKWTIVADGHTFYLFVETGDYTNTLATLAFAFGDFFSYASSDLSNCIIIGRTIENNSGAVQGGTTNIYEPLPILSLMNGAGLSNTITGHFVAANYTNLGGSIAVGKHSDQAKMGCANGGSGQIVGYQGTWNNSTSNSIFTLQFVYPNGPDNGLFQSPIFIHHNGFVRGYLKGLWCPLQHQPLTHNDTFSGSNNLAGKSFIVQNAMSVVFNGASPTSAFAGQYFVEYSDTWN